MGDEHGFKPKNLASWIIFNVQGEHHTFESSLILKWTTRVSSLHEVIFLEETWR